MTPTTKICHFFMVLLVIATTTSAANNSSSSSSSSGCSIDCLHDTECVKGEANFTWQPVRPDTGEVFDFNKEISRNGYHCGCPPGLTGLRCGRTYESCNDGTHTCYNGGQCIDTLEDIYQNEQQYCDCAATVNEDGNTVRYSGKYCEVEVVSKSTRCTENNNICQNGGTCKKTVDELDPCDCPDNYVGRMCEFFEPSVPQCSLKCQHGGSCRYGTKTEDHDLVLNQPGGDDVQDIHVVHENYMYCECPSDYVGVYCETQETVCGDIKCHHGSKCVTVMNLDSGENTHHCDCSEINQNKLDAGEDVQYAGRHCEIESTTVCHFDSHKATTFCTNGGTCPAEPHLPCDCPDGFSGSYCESKAEQTKPSDSESSTSTASTSTTTDTSSTTTTYTKPKEECKLQCKNNGQCRTGTNQDQHVKELVTKYGKDLTHMGLNITYDKNFEHCACPEGFVGVECEYSMKTCGANGEEHPCFHGSTCTMVKGIPTCVCEDSDQAVAGIYCQHIASDVCIQSAEGVQPHSANRGFCVNGGVCVTNKDGDPACRCHALFEGPHCEFTKDPSSTQAISSSAASTTSEARKSSGLSGIAKFGATLALLFCGVVVAFGVVAYRKSLLLVSEDVPPVYPDLDNSLALDDQSLRASPVVDVGPEKDYDGNELKDVEFI